MSSLKPFYANTPCTKANFLWKAGNLHRLNASDSGFTSRCAVCKPVCMHSRDSGHLPVNMLWIRQDEETFHGHYQFFEYLPFLVEKGEPLPRHACFTSTTWNWPPQWTRSLGGGRAEEASIWGGVIFSSYLSFACLISRLVRGYLPLLRDSCVRC